MKTLLKRVARRMGMGPSPSDRSPQRDHDFGHYVARSGAGASAISDSEVRPLYSQQQIDAAVVELKTMFRSDHSPQALTALRAPFAQEIARFSGCWFQRIDFPQHRLTSTSNHEWGYIDEGGLNNLGGRLTSEEASVLRPWPKWAYIQPVLPDLHGKTILEIGSSNGLFCFQFARAGAAKATGVEILKSQFETAIWSAEALGLSNVQFLNTDALLDLTVPQHDIVFMSEVHNHFLCPFYGLLRAVQLARETVILDTGAFDSEEITLNLHTAWDKTEGKLIYHSFQMTDAFIMNYLHLIGIPPSRVIRYKAPPREHHVLYMIDTRNVLADRQRMQYPDYLQDIVHLRYKTRP